MWDCSGFLQIRSHIIFDPLIHIKLVLRFLKVDASIKAALVREVLIL